MKVSDGLLSTSKKAATITFNPGLRLRAVAKDNQQAKQSTNSHQQIIGQLSQQLQSHQTGLHKATQAIQKLQDTQSASTVQDLPLQSIAGNRYAGQTVAQAGGGQQPLPPLAATQAAALPAAQPMPAPRLG